MHDLSELGKSDEKGAYCLSSIGKSACIEEEKACICRRCEAHQKANLNNIRFCIRGPEKSNQEYGDFGHLRSRFLVAVFWPGQPDPTRGQRSHQEEAEQFFKTFATTTWGTIHMWCCSASDWMCSVAKFTGSMTGPTLGP